MRKGLEDLPERIEIAMISEVATGTCAPFPHIRSDQTDLPLGSSSPLLASSLSFSLLSTSGGSLADQIAPDQARWADWTDGLNMLRRDGGHVASQETELFVQALTEIGLKIKLLGTYFLLLTSAPRADVLVVCDRSVGREGRDPERTRGRPAAVEQRFLLLGAVVRGRDVAAAVPVFVIIPVTATACACLIQPPMVFGGVCSPVAGRPWTDVICRM